MLWLKENKFTVGHNTALDAALDATKMYNTALDAAFDAAKLYMRFGCIMRFFMRPYCKTIYL